MATASGVGRTLARVAALSRRRAENPAPVDSRGMILELVQSAAEPVSVEWLSQSTDLHPNTVRGHLEVLVAAGDVVRETGDPVGRGRPPLLYRANPDHARARGELVEQLRGEFGGRVDQRWVEDAAIKWSDSMVGGPVRAADPDEAVAMAAETLDALGFAARVSPVGDSIALTACPYLDLIAEHPVICDIHTVLLRRMIGGTGQPVELGDMEVLPAPGVCRAHLVRSDRRPVRVIRGDSAAGHPDQDETPNKTPNKTLRKRKRS